MTFDNDNMANAYLQQTRVPWTLCLDPKREQYRAYGLERFSWWTMYGPVSVWNYLKLLWQGHRIPQPGRDWRQGGGDVLIDPTGVVRLCYASHSPHDRPAPSLILDHVHP